ncbi:MAG TPA: hypothetical protein VFL89_04730 [Solirubrobacterales bacterium]|nr:hypothetical protein [Solirubrobacterales bacterium]
MSEPGKPRRRAELVDRLLGPDAPELSCEECFEQLDRYVELSLAGAPADQRVPGMRAHLDGCPACAEDFESLRELASDRD